MAHVGEGAGGPMRRNSEAGRFDRPSPPRSVGRDEGPVAHGGSRFDRIDDFRGGGRGGGYPFRGAPPRDDFRGGPPPWNGGGRGGPPDRDEYGRGGGGRFRDGGDMGRGGGRPPPGREECLSRSDLAAERARVCPS
jgi:hypothetical protein